MIIEKPSFEILSTDSYEDMIARVEIAGRVCYKSEGKIADNTAVTFIKNILNRGHESVIEHASITARVICDRGVTHEIVRHRMASYSQESTRYCNYSNDKFDSQIRCIDIATGFEYDLNNETDKKKYEIWQQAMKDCEKHYFEMIELGAKPQEARSILPNSLKTELVITMDMREWRHFFKLRTAAGAHPQMRELSKMMLEEFIKRYPVFFEDLNDLLQ